MSWIDGSALGGGHLHARFAPSSVPGTLRSGENKVQQVAKLPSRDGRPAFPDGGKDAAMPEQPPTPATLRARVLASLAELPPQEHLAALRAIDRGEIDLVLGDDDVRVVIAGLWDVCVSKALEDAA